MAHLGERLRQQRLAKGVSLQHISEQTRIGVRYLEALEAGDFKQLPGAIFARSFVRQYADIVGSDIVSLESELQQIFPSEDVFPVDAQTGILHTDTLLAANGPVWRRLPLTAISLTMALVVSSLLYVGWQRLVLVSETSELQTSAPPPKQPSPKSQPKSSADPSNGSPTVRPAAVTTPEASAATQSAGKSGNELQAPPGTGGVTPMALRVVASERTWVSIAANGKSVFSGILEPYDERTITGVESARMVIGNSTGVDVLTDGRSIGPIGPQGSVRVVVLSPGVPPQISNRANYASPSSSEPDSEPQDREGASATKLD